MPALSNTRHERFAQELAKGSSQSEAYAAAGYTPSEPNASRLTRNDKVAARVVELQERGAIRAETTIADIARQLDEDRSLAHRLGQPGAAVSASMGKAKVLGLVIDKAEVKSEVEVTDARERLARIVSGHAAAAEAGKGAGKPH